MSDETRTTVTPGLDADTEALLRADIERVLSKYSLQSTDVKIDLSAVTVPAKDDVAVSTESPKNTTVECPVTADAELSTKPSTIAETEAEATLPYTSTPEPPTGADLSHLLNPSLASNLQVEMERQRQRAERDRILKSFMGKSVLLADKQKREAEKRQLSSQGATGVPIKMYSLQPAVPRKASAPFAANTAANTTVNVPVTVAPSRSSSGGGSRPGSRHTAVSLPEEPPVNSGEGRVGSERRSRTGAPIPVFSILSKEGSSGSSSGGASHLNNSVSLKESPTPPPEVVHTPLVGDEAASAQQPSILRGGTGTGTGTVLPTLQPPATRTSLVRTHISTSRENQRRASELSRPGARNSLSSFTADPERATPSASTTLPPACATPKRLSAQLPPPSMPAATPTPSLRELLVAQEKEGRVVEQQLNEHQRLIGALHPHPASTTEPPARREEDNKDAHAGGNNVSESTPSAASPERPSAVSTTGLTPSPPPPPPTAVEATPAPPRSPVRASLHSQLPHGTSPRSPAGTSPVRSLSARSSIQVCSVRLPTEPKARAEVVEQFCAFPAGQEVLGTKSRYEYLLATQQQLLNSRKKDEQAYQVVLAKAVEVNQKLNGP